MQNSWGKYMLGELIRVRIDAAHMPEDTNRAHADLATSRWHSGSYGPPLARFCLPTTP